MMDLLISDRDTSVRSTVSLCSLSLGLKKVRGLIDRLLLLIKIKIKCARPLQPLPRQQEGKIGKIDVLFLYEQ
jgi:hypothetical protein